MGASGILVIVLLAVIVIGVVVMLQRFLGKRTSAGAEGGDVVAYLVLALAMGVAGFALARLAATAFPARNLVFDSTADLSTSLPALIVSAPFVVFFWRRQAERRIEFPGSIGWGIYLGLIELFFGIAFVVSGVSLLDGLFGTNVAQWTDAVVFGAILVLHEWAARKDPPAADSGELYRVFGSAIGLITLAIGLVGVFGGGIFTAMQDAISPDQDLSIEWLPWVPMVIVGGAVWAYRWFQPWAAEPGLPRIAWTVTATVGTLWMGLVGLVGFTIMAAEGLFTSADFGGADPQLFPIFLALAVVGFGLWAVHKRALGSERDSKVRFYEYSLAAIGLLTAIGSAIALTTIAFGSRTLVGGDASDVLRAGIPLVYALGVWLWFHTRSNLGAPEEEAGAWPRRLYLLGVGAFLGIASAIALIITLVVVVRRALEGDTGDSLLIPATSFVLTGGAAWYLLALYSKGQAFRERDDVVEPFDVTIICSHPGPISPLFHERAKVKVIHRADGIGVIDEESAPEIVDAVGHLSAIVWVDDDGYRVAPVRAK